MKRRDFLRLTGLAATAVAINGVNLGATTTSGTITTSGWSSDAAVDALAEELHIGDVLTFEGRYAINPITRKATTHLQQFIVTAIDGNAINLIPKPRSPLTRQNTPMLAGS